MNLKNQQKPPASSNISTESAEISIQILIKSWNRRRQYLDRLFFNPKEAQTQTRAPWRNKLAKFLESKTVHAISITMLFLDLIFTILELSFSFLSSEPKKNHDIILWIHWLGISILGLIACRIAALAVALGGAFFRRPGYLIDAAVVVGALLLEGFMEGKGGGLILVVSLWRIVRVVESAFELSDEAIEAQIADIVCQFEVLRSENVKLVELIFEKDEIIEKLQQELDICRCSADH